MKDNQEQFEKCECHCHSPESNILCTEHAVLKCYHCQPSEPVQEKKEWEDEFDKWFNHGTKKEPRFAYASAVYEEVKYYISQNFISREELKKEIEGMKLKKKEPYLTDKCQYCHEYLEYCSCPDYNQALADVLNILERKEK